MRGETTLDQRAPESPSVDLLLWQEANRSRGISGLWLAAAVAAVLYGSLLPFEFDVQSFSGRFDVASIRAGLTSAPVEDIVTNLLIYVPMGLALVLYGNGRCTALVIRLPFAVLLGGGIGCFCELMQTGLAGRVSSLLDVLLNAIGAGCGALLGITVMLAGPRLVRTFRAGFPDRPFSAIATMLALGVFLYHLAPFDFITSTEALRASFLSAQWDFAAIGPFVHGQPEWAVWMDQVSRGAWFVVLGAVCALAGRERGRSPLLSFASAVKHTFILILLLEFMQLFTASHVFELTEMCLGVLAAVFGAWIPVFFVDPATRSSWRHDPRIAVPTLLLVGLILFQAAALLLAEVGFSSLTLASASSLRIQWLPFDELRFGSMRHTFEEILIATVRYGTLGVTLAVLLSRMNVVNVWLYTGLATALLAFAVELLHGATASGTAHLTGPAVAIVVSVLTANAARIFANSRDRLQVSSSASRTAM